MKERPILMSAPMVRALLAGAKTQTRRAVKWRDLEPGLNLQFTGLEVFSYAPGLFTLEAPTRIGWERRSGPTRCPYGLAGDRLWVREAWRTITDYDGLPPREIPARAPLEFLADGDRPAVRLAGKYRPPMFMPRWASRILLEVTGVRVERLQEISREDALAEGLLQFKGEAETWCGSGLDGSQPSLNSCRFLSAAACYSELWESINGAGSWEANPLVWVVEFAKIQP